MDYTKVKQKKDGKVFILPEARLSELYKSDADYEVLEKFKGKPLKG